MCHGSVRGKYGGVVEGNIKYVWYRLQKIASLRGRGENLLGALRVGAVVGVGNAPSPLLVNLAQFEVEICYIFAD